MYGNGIILSETTLCDILKMYAINLKQPLGKQK